ncbi:unnamed protein product [Darwinula stevensoni]|uniref:Uncharacterized protein n=1 Tax=Darwinula stevensoni TaxID=69355 RepID=A0A7R9A7R7_9CRUS|nr:unnamed protein product [Darwinula stevensoni]CAG0893162.1 unnamed protein product [Darwinula stevensoni]
MDWNDGAIKEQEGNREVSLGKVDEVVDQGPKKKHYLVFFYGTYEQAIVKPSDIVPYELKKDELGKEQKRKFFSESEIKRNLAILFQVEQGVLSREATEKIRAKLSKLKGEGGVESPVADAPATKKPRKEKDVLTPAPIVHGESTLSNSSTPPEERVSRSGRVIKPRKFIDEQEEGLALRGEPNATSTPAPGATRRGLRGRPVPPSPVVDKNAELGQISNGMDSSLSEGKPAASHEKLEAVPMTEPSPYDQGEERHSARHQTVRESLDSSEPKLTQRGKRGISESNKHSDSEATLPKRLKRQQQEKKFPVPSFDTSVKISPRDATAKIASRDGTDLHKEAKVAEDKTRATQVPVFKHLASKPDLEKVGAKNVAIVFEEKESQGEKKGKLEDSVKAETNYVTAEVTQPTRDVEKGSEKQMLGEIIPSISVITLEEVSPESMSETEHPIVVSEQTITLKSKPGQSEDEQKGKDEGTSVSGMPKRHQACLEVSEVEKPQTVTDIPGEAMKVPPFIISLTSDTTGKCLEQTQEGVVTQLRKCRVRMPREKKQQPRDISEAEKAKSKEKDCTEPEKKGKMKDTIPRVKEKGIGGEAALLSLLCKEKEAEKKGRAKDNVEPEKKDKDKGKGSPADMSPRKKTMLVKCASGDLVRVTCRNDLPKVFQNEEDEKFYEVRMKENMCCLESLLVRGVYIPPEVKKVMIERGDLSPDFKAHLIEDRKKWKKQVKLK